MAAPTTMPDGSPIPPGVRLRDPDAPLPTKPKFRHGGPFDLGDTDDSEVSAWAKAFDTAEPEKKPDEPQK